MVERICLLVNYNLYESKRHFTQKLEEAMQRRGIETLLIDLQEKPFEADTALQIQNFQPDFTCSFNSFLPLPNKKFFWDILQIPHLSLTVDPIMYNLNLIESPYSVISCVDKNDVEFLSSQKFERAFFLPHAVEKEASIEEEKIYDVVLLGSCYDYETLQEHWLKHHPDWDKTLHDAIETVTSDKYTSLIKALRNAIQRNHLSHSKDELIQLFFYLDYYIRGKDRVELVRSIKDANVHIFGELMKEGPAYQKDWNYYLQKQKNVTMHSAKNFQEAKKVLRQTKVSLNSVPSFKNGSHERIFMSFAAGAVPFTSHSFYMESCFKENEEILFYHVNNKESINEKINYIISNENKRKLMVDQGRKKVMEFHTWDNRVDTILSFAEQ